MLSEKLLSSLNAPQREAVTHTEGPLMVLAGAGSGKTKMLTSRIAYLIAEKKIPANQVLAVTFTNKAAHEMKERVNKTLQELTGGGFFAYPEIGTFHSVCIRILRRELKHTPFTQAFVIYDDSDQLQLIKGVYEKLNLDEKSISPKSVQAAINRLKCDAVSAEEFVAEPHRYFDRQLKQIYEQYQKDLFASHAIDFGEIICLTYRLFRDNQEVRERYQNWYKYIHVDEYQDTNRAQYYLLSYLASKQFGGHQNICVVGDEDQSIYKWRGADIRNILEFENDFTGAHVVKLEQNYRSTQTIITAASQVIRNNSERKDKTLWTANELGLPITRVSLADERSEAEWVVREIKRIAQDEGRSFDEFAIFYRTHSQSRQFEDVFRRERISYQIVGGLRFYDRKEIKDILSYFKFILNPFDSISLKRIINVPARGIGKTTLDKIQAYTDEKSKVDQKNYSFWEGVQLALKGNLLSGAAAKKITQFQKLMSELMEFKDKSSLIELYHSILDKTQYVQLLKDEATEESLARVENLEEFDTLLNEFEEENYNLLSESEKLNLRPQLLELFLEQSALVNETQMVTEELSQVKMMTLHSSKGLEYPVVFLPGMEEGLFPSVRPWEEGSDEDLEEERRLCYVGMTRARERLYMLHAAVRRQWGNILYQEPARFFEEIDNDLIDYRDLSKQISRQYSHSYSNGYSGLSSSGSPRYGSNYSGGKNRKGSFGGQSY